MDIVTDMNQNQKPVMEYDHLTGEVTFRDFTPEEQADNDAREAATERMLGESSQPD